MISRSPRVASVMALLCAMVSIQTGATLAKQLFPLVGPQGTTALRLLFAAAILLVVWRPFRRPINRHQAMAVALYGAALGGMNMFFYMALARLPLGIAVSVEFTGPLMVAVFNARRPVDFLWVLLAATGLLLLSPGADPAAHIDPIGVLLALGAGACWAMYIIFGQRSGSTLPGGTATSLGMLVAAVCVAPVGIVHAGPSLLQPALWPLALAVAVLSSALPYSLEMVALRRLPARTFSVMMSLEPAIGALSGRVFLREHLTSLQWLAIACVMLASGGAALTTSAKSPHLQARDG